MLRATRKAEVVVEELFRALSEEPELLPSAVQERFLNEEKMRVVADYVAGMTDRFALSEHEKLLNPRAGAGK